MRTLFLLLFSASAFGQTFDYWGGNTAFPSPGSSAGKWTVEKYTVNGRGRWLITTPNTNGTTGAGHGFYWMSQMAVGFPGGVNVTTKYGSTLNAQKALAHRYKGFGFNAVGEDSDGGFTAGLMNNTLDGIQMPMAQGDSFFLNPLKRRSGASIGMIPFTLPTDAVKTLLNYTLHFTNGGSNMADGTDPNLATYDANWAQARMSATNLATDSYAQTLNNPWTAIIGLGDTDYMWGIGAQKDQCTTGDGDLQPSAGWIAIAVAPQAYIQWFDSGNPYDGMSSCAGNIFCSTADTNWRFTDTTVHAKASLISYLKTAYGNSISALNAAWGSNYTAFNTAAVRHTGETIATTNGSAVYDHSFANSNVSPDSLAIKVDGVLLGTDKQFGGGGTIIGQWPDGATNMGGTVNFTNSGTCGSAAAPCIELASTTACPHGAGCAVQINATGSTNLGTINLHANVVPGSIVVRLFPQDCHVTDDGGSGNSWQTYAGCPSTLVGFNSVSGTINYSTGVITSFTVSPAIPALNGSGQQNVIEFQYKYNTPLPGTHTITVDYDTNGYCVGSTIEDECGLNQAWLGLTDGNLNKYPLQPTATPNTPASGTYSYQIRAVNAGGGTLGVSAATKITNGPASLGSGANSILLSWGPSYPTGVIGVSVTQYCVIRNSGGASQGQIGCVTAIPGAMTFTDTGQAGDSATYANDAVPLTVFNDLSAWAATYFDSMFANSIDQIRPYFSTPYISTPSKIIFGPVNGIGGHKGCPRKEVAVAMSNHADITNFSQLTQQLLDLMVVWGLGDKPIMDSWEAYTSFADSPLAFECNGGCPMGVTDFLTQSAKGTAYANQATLALTGRGSGGSSYTVLGLKIWSGYDTDIPSGWLSPNDNAYDGHEAVTASVTCSPPLNGSVVGPYTCGSETANYGNMIGNAGPPILNMWTTIGSGSAFSSQPAKISSGVKCAGCKD